MPSLKFASVADYAFYNGAVATAGPLSMMACGRTSTFAAAQIFATLGVVGSQNNCFTLGITPSGSVRADTRDGSGSATAFSSAVIAANVPFQALAVLDDNYLAAFANGGNSGSITTPRTPGGINYTILGKKPDGSSPFVGELAWFAIWAARLTVQDADAMWNGVPPHAIKRDSLLSVFPWLGSGNNYDPVGGTTLTLQGTISSVWEPPFAYNRVRRTYSVPLPTPALGYLNPPAITATTTSTASIAVTPTASCTYYGVAVATGSAAPSVSQIKAGQNAAGAAAIFAANKAITGADSLGFTGLTFPIYDFYFVLSNGVTDSAVAVIARAMLSAPAGKQFVTHVPGNQTGKSIIDNASPAVAAGDIMVFDTVTFPDGFAVVPRANGEFVYRAHSSAARQRIAADNFDVSAGAYLGPGFFWSNNQTPTPTDESPDFPNSFVVGQVVNIDLVPLRPDPEGDSTTWTKAAGPAWFTVVANRMIGTVTGIGEQQFDFDVSDGLNTVRATYFAQVSATAPNVIGQTEAAASATLIAAGLVPVHAEAVSVSIPVGRVISQNPTAGTPVSNGQSVTLTISLGNIQPPTVNGSIPSVNYGIGQTISAINVATVLPGATSFAVVVGALPAGVVLDPVTGLITGAALAEFSSQIVIRGTNAAGSADTNAFQFLVTAVALPVRIVIQIAP